MYLMKRVAQRQDDLRERLRSGRPTVLPVSRRFAKLLDSPTRLGLELESQVRGTDDQSLTCSFVASTSERDRDGDEVLASGGQFEAYRRNPVVLVAHGEHGWTLPVGKCLSVQVYGEEIHARLQFDAGDRDAREIYRKIRDGYLNAMSIGFMPLEGGPISKNQDFPGYRFTAWELLELSIVSVPANANALVIQRGLDMATFQREVRGLQRETNKLKALLPRYIKEIEVQERTDAAAEKLSEMGSEDVFAVMRACADVLASRFANEPPSLRSAITGIVSAIERAASQLRFF